MQINWLDQFLQITLWTSEENTRLSNLLIRLWLRVLRLMMLRATCDLRKKTTCFFFFFFLRLRRICYEIQIRMRSKGYGDPRIDVTREMQLTLKNS